jgi:transposase
VIGLDCHPDSFTAALVRGPTPAAAITEKILHKIPIARLESWAREHTSEKDTLLLEASGNSFHLARTLQRLGRKALVLESCHLGKLKEAHANNDKISAVRIAKAYLAGTAKLVWIPDPRTQERRDWFYHQRKLVKRTTQMRNRIRSYLSDQGVRLGQDFALQPTELAAQSLRSLHPWSPRQWHVLEGLLMQWRHAEEQRAHWTSLIAQEVVADPQLLSLVRLVGVREMVAFAVGAFVGDIHRFADPKKLVKYVGLNPAFDDSGENEWSGGLSGHGNKELRALLIESAQSILRSPSHPVAKWGKKLLARKGEINLVVAAVARRLVVAIWHLMMGRWTNLEQIDASLRIKLGKIISHVGAEALKHLGKSRKSLRQEMEASLKSGPSYRLDSDKKLTPRSERERASAPVARSRRNSLAYEYGLVEGA